MKSKFALSRNNNDVPQLTAESVTDSHELVTQLWRFSLAQEELKFDPPFECASSLTQRSVIKFPRLAECVQGRPILETEENKDNDESYSVESDSEEE